MKLGIVGLPNVGKSTLFNAITRAGAESANYPFCTTILRNTHLLLSNSLTLQALLQALPKAKAWATSSYPISESAMPSYML